MAPIFVGSNSDDTRIRSNRVGLAASTSDPGSASEGDIYYDSTNNLVKTYDGSAWSAIQGSGTVSLVASGTLSNGATVVINTDGTVSVVGPTDPGTPTFGSATVFESDTTDDTTTTFDSANGKVVIAYRDTGNSNYGTAVVGTVSGTSISFGTPVVFRSAATYDLATTFDSSNNKVVIAYRDNPNNNHGTAIVGTVSGTSISFGGAVVFRSSDTRGIRATFDSTNNKVVISYRDATNGNGYAIVGTVSSTTISFGTQVEFETGETFNSAPTFDSTNGKVVIAYRDAGNSNYGTAIVGTVSGTSISFGTAVVFNSATTTHIGAAFDSSNGKVVVAYRDGGNSEYGTGVVGTVSGTSISFGTAVVYSDSDGRYNTVTFDSNTNRIIISYYDDGNSNYGTAVEGSVTGTAVTFGSPVVFESADIGDKSATFDSTNNKVVIVYDDNGNSSYGTAIVATATTNTNLTSENFIGFSDAAYSDGDTANIQIISSVDDAQSGLTTGSKFYVQNDGTLSTTAGDPSVLAGTAVSGTEILIKQ